jgi:hypothetical protein
MDAAPTAKYTTRVLSIEEWTLRRYELPYPPGGLDPGEYKRLVVVEDEGRNIVASWVVMNLVMLEGLNVVQGHPMAGKHLLFGMMKTLLDDGVPAATTRIEDPAVMALAEHAGFVPVPGTLYQIVLGGA